MTLRLGVDAEVLFKRETLGKETPEFCFGLGAVVLSVRTASSSCNVFFFAVCGLEKSSISSCVVLRCVRGRARGGGMESGLVAIVPRLIVRMCAGQDGNGHSS